MAELAIAWLSSHSWVSTVIAGVTKTWQVTANAAAAEWKLSSEEMLQLDQVTGYRMYSLFSIGPRKYKLPPGYLAGNR